MKKITLLLVSGALLIASNVLGASRGDLFLSEGVETTSIDPHKCYVAADLNYAQTIFDKLLKRDSETKIIPRLATSYKCINDTTWEFKLRKGVKFHNGEDFTADDVKFSFERILNPATKDKFMGWYKTIKKVEIVDDYTVRIITHAPDPLLINRVAFVAYIVPADYIRSKGESYFMEHPVGTGAFKFVKWMKADRLIVEANEGYWDGPPGVKRIIFKPIPEPSTRLAELQAGAVDIITNVPPFLIKSLKDAENLDVLSIPSGRVMYCYINTVAEGPLKDKRVRQALNYSIDRKAIISKLLMGSGIEIATLLTSYHFGYDETLKPYPFDPQKAKALLAEAGYSKGLKLMVNSPSGRYLMDKEVAEAVSGMLSTVGIQTEFKVWEWGSYVGVLVGKKLKDVGFIGWRNSLYDTDGTYTPLVAGTMEQYKKSPFSYYVSPTVTKMLNEARTTLNNRKRTELYKKVQRIIYDEAPFVFLYQQMDHYGINNRVKHLKVRGDEFLDLNDVVKE